MLRVASSPVYATGAMPRHAHLCPPRPGGPSASERPPPGRLRVMRGTRSDQRRRLTRPCFGPQKPQTGCVRIKPPHASACRHECRQTGTRHRRVQFVPGARDPQASSRLHVHVARRAQPVGPAPVPIPRPHPAGDVLVPTAAPSGGRKNASGVSKFNRSPWYWHSSAARPAARNAPRQSGCTVTISVRCSIVPPPR